LLNMRLHSMLSEKEMTFCSLEVSEANSHETLLEAKAFELKGPAENLEKQKMDFRYAPKRWQACIGLPDDPHKSIVDDYGGGRFYDFNVRVVADLETEGNKGDIKQQLLDPKTPVVITEQQFGGLMLRQRAWARAPESRTVEQWSNKRIDYLWLELENRGSSPKKGRIVLKIDSDKPLQVDRDMQHVYYAAEHHPFCIVSPKCVSYFPEASEEGKPGPERITALHLV